MKSTKEVIQEKAARLFRKQGYKATSMRSIAEAVGIKAASIYKHYSSKEAILQGLLMSMANRFTMGMQSINASSLTVNQKLEKLIELHVRLTVEHTDAIALIASSDWIYLEENCKKEYLKLRDEYESEFKEIIEIGKQEGVFKQVNTDIALFSILSTLRWLYSWYSKNKKYNLMDLEQQMVICLLDGLKKG